VAGVAALFVPRLRTATVPAAAEPTTAAPVAVAAEPAASRGPAGELDPVS